MRCSKVNTSLKHLNSILSNEFINYGCFLNGIINICPALGQINSYALPSAVFTHMQNEYKISSDDFSSHFAVQKHNEVQNNIAMEHMRYNSSSCSKTHTITLQIPWLLQNFLRVWQWANIGNKSQCSESCVAYEKVSGDTEHAVVSVSYKHVTENLFFMLPLQWHWGRWNPFKNRFLQKGGHCCSLKKVQFLVIHSHSSHKRCKTTIRVQKNSFKL